MAVRKAFHIWLAPAYQLSAARQITFGETRLFDPRESSDGKIIAGDLDHRLWILNADGSKRQSFLESYFPLWFEPCGNRAIFLSWDNQVSLMRVDADGLNPTALFRGDVWNATCSPDGSLVYYYNFAAPEKIWRVATAGGTPDAISDIAGEGGLSRISVSPDGKFLTYIYGTVRPMAWNLAVVPAEGGPPVRHYPVPGGTSGPRWSPSGRGLQYLVTRDGVTNIWEQPLAGGRPTQLTIFSSGETFDFTWSADYKRLLFARGSVSTDVILIRNLR